MTFKDFRKIISAVQRLLNDKIKTVNDIELAALITGASEIDELQGSNVYALHLQQTIVLDFPDR